MKILMILAAILVFQISNAQTEVPNCSKDHVRTLLNHMEIDARSLTSTDDGINTFQPYASTISGMTKGLDGLTGTLDQCPDLFGESVTEGLRKFIAYGRTQIAKIRKLRTPLDQKKSFDGFCNFTQSLIVVGANYVVSVPERICQGLQARSYNLAPLPAPFVTSEMSKMQSIALDLVSYANQAWNSTY